jgi:ribonuclease P protein component
MLAAAHRLRRREEFSAAVRGGRRAGAGVLVVHLTTTAGADHGAGRVVVSGEPPGEGTPAAPSRVGFVIPKAVGNAVTRNRVRRRLRHLMRDRLDNMTPGTDIVVRALPGAGSAAYPRLEADLDAALAGARTRKSRTPAGRRPSAEATGLADPTGTADATRTAGS